ncbi:conditioned medium-induced protein 4 [Halomicrobium sp. HM KBTZ05]|uniref:conditioned medium-induced protein 4 n=1 Tax=Halomicrobium sp. HM KBTZ05 TaxID=3242663 RepID=UPI00355618D4
MDEKTEELRDIFVDVAGEDTVTERQEDGHGSLLSDEGGVEERLLTVIDRLRERFEVDTPLSDEALVTVVRRYYEGDDDAAIADAVDADTDVVTRARIDLHLLRDEDTDAPFDLARLREADTGETVREAFDLTEAELARYRRVVAAQTRARQVSGRFQSEYEDVLHDAGIGTVLTDGVRDDGLKEATEDIGSLEEDADVDF